MSIAQTQIPTQQPKWSVLIELVNQLPVSQMINVLFGDQHIASRAMKNVRNAINTRNELILIRTDVSVAADGLVTATITRLRETKFIKDDIDTRIK